MRGLSPPRKPTLTMKRVLVVDDNTINRRLLAQQLRTSGFPLTITTASNGPAAVAAVIRNKQLPYHLIIIDFSMPIKGSRVSPIDGVKAAEIIKARQPDIKIVLWTTTLKSTLPKFAEDLFVAQLPKPANPKQINEILNKVFTAPRPISITDSKDSAASVISKPQKNSPYTATIFPAICKSPLSSNFSAADTKDASIASTPSVQSPLSTSTSPTNSISSADTITGFSFLSIPAATHALRASPINSSPLPARSLSSSPSNTRPSTSDEQPNRSSITVLPTIRCTAL